MPGPTFPRQIPTKSDKKQKCTILKTRTEVKAIENRRKANCSGVNNTLTSSMKLKIKMTTKMIFETEEPKGLTLFLCSTL